MTAPDWKELHARLSAPFPADAIHWRLGHTNKKDRGMALAYIDARDVMDRLDEVCGAENWETRFTTAAGRIICELTIHGVTKSDGAGDTDVEPEKGGISDALKRAAVQFGIGRYLYRLESPWVEIEPAGRSFRIKPGQEAKLAAALASGPKPFVPASDPPPHHTEDPFGPSDPEKADAPLDDGSRQPAPSTREQPDEDEFFFRVSDPPPEEPTFPKWKADALRSGKMAGKTWAEIAQGSWKGQRHKWCESLATWDEAKPATRQRALWCLYQIEKAERIRRDVEAEEF